MIEKLPNKIKIIVADIGTKPIGTLKGKDVVGQYDEKNRRMLHDGMIVGKQKTICPIWNDPIPYKSCTVVCSAKLEPEVRYWLAYYHRGEFENISNRKEFEGDNGEKI